MTSTVTVAGHPLNAAQVIDRLEEAGFTLLTIDRIEPSMRLASKSMTWLVELAKAERIKASVPTRAPRSEVAARMDEAFGWVSCISDQGLIVQRILAVRSFISPITERYVYSWHRLGVALGADHKTMQRLHRKGVAAVVDMLAAQRRHAA